MAQRSIIVRSARLVERTNIIHDQRILRIQGEQNYQPLGLRLSDRYSNLGLMILLFSILSNTSPLNLQMAESFGMVHVQLWLSRSASTFATCTLPRPKRKS